MSVKEFKIGGITMSVPQQFKKQKKRKQMSQQEKVELLAGVVLTRLFSNGTCTIEELGELTAGKITGRLNVTLGAGVGGQGGMNLLRSNDGRIMLCRDNVLNLLHLLGPDAFGKWAESETVTSETFQTWFDRLPLVDG